MSEDYDNEPERVGEPAYETWFIADLRPYARNSELFGDLPEADFAQLVESIHEHGLESPPEILPDGTILRGHQRVRACEQLGYEEVDCWVRYDLVDADAEELLQFVLRDNTRRRQMTLLDRVRIAHELLRAQGLGLRSRVPESERERIAKSLGTSTRTVTRLLAVARTPMAVQQAVNAGQLPIATAGKIAGLSNVRQAEIAKQIEDGAAAKEVAAKALVGGYRRAAQRSGASAESTQSPRDIRASLQRLIDEIQRLSPRAFKPRVKLHPGALREAAAQLNKFLGGE
ncbi:MAG: ParB/RepB/Spo0J family partition protein [Planctomycetales bacterium]|nr:ParB/RepB/Spo0J family partition protein [Planctomycetales bacterium]